MATGRYSKWVTAKMSEPIRLGKKGIEIDIWEKWGKKRGTAIISVGGIRWRSYKCKSFRRISWRALDLM